MRDMSARKAKTDMTETCMILDGSQVAQSAIVFSWNVRLWLARLKWRWNFRVRNVCCVQSRGERKEEGSGDRWEFQALGEMITVESVVNVWNSRRSDPTSLRLCLKIFRQVRRTYVDVPAEIPRRRGNGFVRVWDWLVNWSTCYMHSTRKKRQM